MPNSQSQKEPSDPLLERFYASDNSLDYHKFLEDLEDLILDNKTNVAIVAVLLRILRQLEQNNLSICTKFDNFEKKLNALIKSKS